MSKRREIALEVIEAYNAWDIERIMGYRAENCVQQVAPSRFPQHHHRSVRASP